MPDDLGTKVFGAEDLIEERTYQVNSVTVAMEKHAAVIRDDPVYFAQTLEQERRILLLRRPKVIERKLPRAISWSEPMHFLSEKGWIEVCQVHGLAPHLSQHG
jgi:hypothetical protein